MEESNIIEVVKMLPISSDPKRAEFELNSMIYNIQHNHDITVHEDLCGAIDPYKFIFAFQENKDGSGDPTSSYGVLVIETAADYQETERRINDALDSMRNDSENVTSFISIARASEFMYIVFYKIGGTASYPVVKIKTVASDPNPAGHYIEKSFESWKEDEGLFPYDKIMIDKNHIMFLCDDI